MDQTDKNQKNAEPSATDDAVEAGNAPIAEALDDDPTAVLQRQLEDLKRLRDEWREKAYRAAAELDNTRKRFQKERVELRSFGIEPLIQDLLPVADNLERALAHAAAEKNLVEGVEMVLRQFMQIMATKGAVPFDADGQAFDPSIHEAMGQIPSSDHPPGTVLEVFQQGWMLKDRLVRPAMVIVAAEPVESSQDTATGPEEEPSA